LSWQDNSSEESGFMVYRSVNNGSYSQIAVVSKNVITLSDTAGLTPGSTYSYKVLAYNVSGLSGYSNAAAVSVPVVPSAPTNLSAVAVSSSRINLSWTDNSSNETGFFVERRVSGGSFTKIATLGANVKTYSSINLKANTSYSYRIRAYNSSGNSSYSNTVYAVTLK